MSRSVEEQAAACRGVPLLVNTPNPHADARYTRLVDEEHRLLPMRRAVMGLRRLSKLKSLLNFLIFFCAYIALSTVRLDWWHGHETLAWLGTAHVTARQPVLSRAETVAEIASYLDASLSEVVAELKQICSHCEVGLTPQSQDMTFLGLADFICSDFDSTVGARDYPPRDCVAEDRVWARHPSSLTAPCCDNATLVRASVAMMTEALAYGITRLPLATLLSGGTDPSYSSTEYFVQFYIDHKAFILQMIVSREQRMAATSYYVRKRKKDAPDLVQVVPSYWSFNYANMGLQSVLWGAMMLGGALTLAHDRRRMVDHFCGNADLARVAEREDEQRSIMSELLSWALQWSPYVVLVQLPSVVLPLALEVLMPFLQLPMWTFWVAFTEMLLSIRLLHEGTLVPALRRIVAVIDVATPNMIALFVVLAPMIMLTSVMHSQLFGLFDEGFSDPFVSLTRIINMLTAPPPPSNTEGVIFESQEQGAELLFYWSTFVIRLCFGSFIVAILVGAFNNVVASEAAKAKDNTRDATLPPNYVDASDAEGCARLRSFIDFFLTARLYGSYEPRLVQALEAQIELTESEDASAKEQQLMVSANELVELVGARPASLLLGAHGARLLADELDHSALDA